MKEFFEEEQRAADAQGEQDGNQQRCRYKFEVEFELNDANGSALIAIHPHKEARKEKRLTRGKQYHIRVASRMRVTEGVPYPTILRLAYAREIVPVAPRGDEVVDANQFIRR